MDQKGSGGPAPDLHSALLERFHRTFGRAPEIAARAPGRIEFIGNHTDYNGGTVLGVAIDRRVWVALAGRTDGQWNFASEQKEGVVSLRAGEIVRQDDSASWVNYPLGVISALRPLGLAVQAGFDYLAMSDLPLGAGLSSSAAIEMASGLAFTELTQLSLDREQLVKAALDAENNFVGVPCGILDQGVSGFGRKDHLVFIDCRGPRFAIVPLPGEAQFWIFNTHTKHALVDGLYAARHRECMDAAQALGVPRLVDVSPEALAAAKGTFPPVLEKRARHIVDEIARVAATVAALKAGDLKAVGELLTASHRSSQHLFENSTPELDFLVDQLTSKRHVFGARLTGGGFGGAVMALTSPDFGDTEAQAVAESYQKQFGAGLDILHLRTADGAELLRPQ